MQVVEAVKPNWVEKVMYTYGLTSFLARQSVMCVRKKSKQFFYSVKSSSSSQGAPGTKADSVHQTESYLLFVGLSVLLFPSSMHVQLSQIFAFPLFSHFVIIL